ncbi:MAG: AAA family ATPase [Acidimicrobiia bacterium]
MANQPISEPLTAPAGAGTADGAPQFGRLFDALTANVERVLQGKQEVVRLALTALFAEGHLLIEDVPGVGKTSLAKSMAASIAGAWRRVQFTPDLLPSDVTGVSVWNRQTNEFEFRPGGIFTNILLADEINRASPKTQSALLEAMEEHQVTVDARSYRLPRPFMVIATQNPVELEGTYALPEAQLDRFLMRIRVGYPDRNAEIEILGSQGDHPAVEDLAPVASAADIVTGIALANSAHVAPTLRAYIVDLAAATRHHPECALGVSPRGALALQRTAKARAAAAGRDFVTPDDVKAVAVPVLEHRLILTPDAQMRRVRPGDILDEILGSVAVPGSTG